MPMLVHLFEIQYLCHFASSELDKMTALSSLDHDRDELTHILSQMNDILSITRLSHICPTDQVKIPVQNGPV